MKFGAQLKEGLYPEWRFYYLDYDGLKRQLKERTKSNNYQETDEAYYVELLERELEKVYGFQVVKLGEIHRRVESLEERVKKLRQQGIVAHVEDEADGAEGERDEEERRLLDLPLDYQKIEDEVNQVLEEVNELARFTRLNYSGFLKIIKKHDKHTNYVLKPMFMVRLNARPFYRENFDDLILQLSRLYDVVRNGGRDPSERAATTGGSGAQNFVRRTTKYWVHPDNVLELKFYVLKYLPVLLFQSAKNTTGSMSEADGPLSAPDPAISSVYFDNDSLDLYQGRLEKTEGAEAIRFRWYGPVTNNEIFIERKTHREDWTGESSVKQRFPLKEKHVNAFMRGEYTLDKTIAKMRAAGTRKPEDIDALEVLAGEIQASISAKRLKPTMRTFYNRTAFQLPGDATVRISLDTELSLIREDSLDGKPRAGDNWRRTDVGTHYPFSHLPDSEICRFPYAILEVKLQTEVGTDPPQWVTNLVQSHLVEEVPKFSKFIHGCATLLEPHVQLLPFWLPQMDKDIRKRPRLQPRSSLLVASRPHSRDVSPGYSERDRRRSAGGLDEDDHEAIEVVVDDGRREADDARAMAALSTSPRQERDYMAGSLRREKRPATGRVQPRQYRPRDDRHDERAPLLSQSGISSSSRAAARDTRSPSPTRSIASKRVAVPVRVEPKVFFANERTFLSWVHFAVVLGGLALGLLNFGDKVGRTAGVLFTVISMGILVYALFLYIWRSNRIRAREPGPYDDRVGPAVLVGVILAAVIINFYLKFSSLQQQEPPASGPVPLPPPSPSPSPIS
ncbi:VTC domain-containing protein [Syncephalis pseudoplumigaleata]|uniref:Vacuolar transporter chaperone complex subunit 4 n=1 Tax=Syncephalis pseudoplumigaleata TaxID=1712513 RepID=A0A4P9Z448_9FUNG|nr:VTC domain-containing protein [Syncephalis pseudoplumigaleata]|eukprot:RKP27215.1 VTC domain-containing protein [Syncephalis pseudoplumigaleata]